MSYIAFREETFDELERLLSIETNVSKDRWWALFDVATELVFSRWMAEQRFEALIAWVHENFDGVGGDRWIVPLGESLLLRQKKGLVRRLWSGVIANRTRSFWSIRRDYPHLSADEAKSKAIAAMENFATAMRQLNDEECAKRIQDDIWHLQQEKRRKSKGQADKRQMSTAIFWELLESAKTSTSCSSESLEWLTARLEQFSLMSIKAFQKELHLRMSALMTYELWALAFIARRGCGDDEFDYFRAWVVLQGEHQYKLALRDLRMFAKTADFGQDPQAEALMYAAPTAYENKKGEAMRISSTPNRPIEGEYWEESDLPVRYADLCQLMNYQTNP